MSPTFTSRAWLKLHTAQKGVFQLTDTVVTPVLPDEAATALVSTSLTTIKVDDEAIGFGKKKLSISKQYIHNSVAGPSIIDPVRASMSTLRSFIHNFCNWFPGQKSKNRDMASKKETPTATDELHHRYADTAVLRKALIEMGFKDKDIKIIVRFDPISLCCSCLSIFGQKTDEQKTTKKAKESDGLRVNLPKQLTEVR